MPKIDKAALGARVRKLRVGIGLSQIKLAKATGMKQQGIGNIEKGIVEKPRNLLELAKVLGTTPEWLLYQEGPEKVRLLNAREQLAEAVQNLSLDRVPAALEYLRQLSEDEADVA